ncbi:MAG: ParA family protein [Planctomycetota bacterium]|jgi:chromosome partitioning protein
MRTVALLNQKGGVGKTTTTVNLGAILAQEFGKKVLLVDVDPQGNMSDHVGLDPNETERSVYDIIIRQEAPESIVLSAFGMDIIPANLDLAGAEVELASMTVRETRLRNALRGFSRNYDVVLIDCPPSLGLLTLSALCLATEVLVPMQAEYLAMRGLSQLVHTVSLVQEHLNPKLEITGVVFCQYNTQTRLSGEVRNEVAEHFGDAIYETTIRRNVKLAESSSHGEPTVHYDPTCAGVDDYRRLAAEFLRKGGEDVPMPESKVTTKPAPSGPPPANVTFVE